MAIIIENLTKEFNNHLVVNKLNLEIKDGELFVLLGSSGSGKSTILRIIAGLLYQDEGKIFLHGKDVTTLSPQKREIGFVFQNYAIFKNMTVQANVEFGLKIRGIKKKERKLRAENMLDLVGLNGFNERFPRELSGGQRQRVALARALVYEPKVLLLDEPFGALDAEIRGQLRNALKEIQRKLGVTTILVTHDQEEAFELGDRIGILEKGNLIEVGTPQDLYYKPKKEFVAKFLGGGNVVVGRCEKGEIRLGDAKLKFPLGVPAHEEGAPVRILFRPEMVLHQTQEFQEGCFFPIGKGVLKECKFAGAINKLEFELDSLTGTRPVMPALSYGQRFAKIACTEQSIFKKELKIGDVQNLALSSYHVLDPSALKFIILVQNFDSVEGGLSIGRNLALSSHGTLSLLGVCDEIEDIDRVQKGLKKVKENISKDYEYHFDTRVRGGKVIKEFVNEVQEGYYDMAIVDFNFYSNSKSQYKITPLVKSLLLFAGVPVLVANDRTTNLGKFLICTKGGEPGKNDIRFGARIARHIKGDITLYHVLLESSKKEEIRMKEYMENASAIFEAYNLKCKYELGKGNFFKNLLNKIKEENSSLVILGASFVNGDELQNAVHKIISETSASVLIVPSYEGM